MRHRSRHAAHGGQFFGAQLGFHFPQIMQKHDAQRMGHFRGGAGVWTQRLHLGDMGANMNTGLTALIGALQMDSHRQRPGVGETGVDGLGQWVPPALCLQRKILTMFWQAKQLQGCGVGLQHLQATVHNQNPVSEVVDDQRIDLLLSAGAQLTQDGDRSLTAYALGQFMREIGNAKITGAGKGCLVVGLAGITEAIGVLPGGMREHEQGHAGGCAKCQ